MTWDMVLRDGNRIKLGKERFKIVKKLLLETPEEKQPTWLEIGTWGIIQFNMIGYLQRGDDGKFRPDGY